MTISRGDVWRGELQRLFERFLAAPLASWEASRPFRVYLHGVAVQQRIMRTCGIGDSNSKMRTLVEEAIAHGSVQLTKDLPVYPLAPRGHWARTGDRIVALEHYVRTCPAAPCLGPDGDPSVIWRVTTDGTLFDALRCVFGLTESTPTPLLRDIERAATDRARTRDLVHPTTPNGVAQVAPTDCARGFLRQVEGSDLRQALEPFVVRAGPYPDPRQHELRLNWHPSAEWQPYHRFRPTESQDRKLPYGRSFLRWSYALGQLREGFISVVIAKA